MCTASVWWVPPRRPAPTPRVALARPGFPFLAQCVLQGNRCNRANRRKPDNQLNLANRCSLRNRRNPDSRRSLPNPDSQRNRRNLANLRNPDSNRHPCPPRLPKAKMSRLFASTRSRVA